LRDHGFGFALRKRRQPVLQALQVACHHDADHIRPCRQKLSELEIGRSKSGQRARQARAGLGAGALDDPRQAQRKLPGGGTRLGSTTPKHALAREHETGAGEPHEVSQCRNHKRQPNATPHDAARQALPVDARKAGGAESSRQIAASVLEISGSIRRGY